jgi:predicted outer membrane repeat protein
MSRQARAVSNNGHSACQRCVDHRCKKPWRVNLPAVRLAGENVNLIDLYFYNNSNSALNITDSSFDLATVVVSNSSCFQNKSQQGASIWSVSNMVLNNVTIENSSATNDGGGIYFLGVP